MRALLLLACLSLIAPTVAADDGEASSPDENQGSYVCEAETSEASGSPVFIHNDPMTLAVQNPDLPIIDHGGKAGYVGVSVYPAGNGPCVIVQLPAL